MDSQIENIERTEEDAINITEIGETGKQKEIINFEQSMMEHMMEIEEDEEADEQLALDTSLEVTARPRQLPFKFKRKENGNILTVHHTIREQSKLVRIRLSVCCFSERNAGLQFVAVDKRGNIFVFDFVTKRYWRFPQILPKASVIRASPLQVNTYLIGSKLGQLVHVDVEKCQVLNSVLVTNEPIKEISFPGQPLQPSRLVLVHVGFGGLILNLDTFTLTHRLDFDQTQLALKFACYLPFSDQIFTCFTNDSIHVWSAITLSTVRITYPRKARDRRIRLQGIPGVPVFSLESKTDDDCKEFELDCQTEDYSDGIIIAYCYPPEGGVLCLSTLDRYLLLLSTYTFELQSMYRMRDFVVKECAFLPKPKQAMILCLTTAGQVLLLDTANTEFKLVVKSSAALNMSLSNDGKLLAVLALGGQADIWSTSDLYNTLKSQQQCMQALRAAYRQSKPVMPCVSNEFLNENIKRLLKRERLYAILKEYSCYPAKYRKLIWCTLLQLPYNRREFQLLLKKDTPPLIKQRAVRIQLKNETLKRALVQVWSCLAHWCKVFAYSEFLPCLIFPFVQLFPRNLLVAFEICATLLLNHFNLWFEFHPLEPTNYLGMCENILQCVDPELCKFYASMEVLPKHYAWRLLSTGFSEVLDEEQWMCLWDNIISCQTYFPIFCTVAYNMLQREVLLRLPDKQAVFHFFQEQNAVDVNKLVSKACRLMQKCPPSLHPKRYIKKFDPLPKNVYPKFLAYPKEWVAQHEEELASLRKEHCAIDARIRQLELEEIKMMEHMEKELKEEQFKKSIKEMEKLYQDTLKREEERVACQHKLLLLYQKEIRSRRGEVMATIQESARRKKALELETELESLRHNIERERRRNETNLTLAEDEIRNQDFELMTQKYFANMHTQPLAQKFQTSLERLERERDLLRCRFKKITSRKPNEPIFSDEDSDLDDVEKEFNDIQKEFQSLRKMK